MEVMLVGLPERDTFALSLLIGKYFPEWTYRTQDPAHVCLCGGFFVVDAEGCTKHGEQTVLEWLQAVHGRPTVLVTGHMSAEAEQRLSEYMKATPQEQSLLVRLQRPFGAKDMRDALRNLAQQAQERQAAGQLSAVDAEEECNRPGCDASPASGTEPPLVVFDSGYMPTILHATTPLFNLDSGSPPASGPIPKPLPVMGEGRLTLPEFLECVERCPTPESKAFLDGFVEQMASGQPFEMVLTLINRLIFHVGEGWVASSTPVSVLRVVMRSRSLGQLVRYSSLNVAAASPRARAEQRGMTVYPLEDFFYVLAALADAPPTELPQAPSVP